MTSASELFFNRRFRLGTRNTNPNPLFAVDPTPSADLHRRPPRRNCHGDACGHSRHRVFEAEHEPVQSDTSSSNHGGTVRGRVNQSILTRGAQGTERLPGTVVQARARLFERLRGISASDNRNELVVDPDDWEIEVPREWIEYDARENASKKKPAGLSLETICDLPQEGFEDTQENEGLTRISIECCICLERFQEGERLSLLPCFHRFHPSCLEPWLRNCGNCPNCRTSV